MDIILMIINTIYKAYEYVYLVKIKGKGKLRGCKGNIRRHPDTQGVELFRL